ncbi:MAG: hypothetical protein ACYDBQ_09930 [Thermoplasmatota archaeon]
MARPSACPLGALLLLVAGCTTPVIVPPECPGHWHAEQLVYLNGHEVNFQDPHFYLEGPAQGIRNRMPVSSHMHQNIPNEWHFEPSPSKCVPLGQANPFIGMDLTPNSLALTGAHAQIPLPGTNVTQGGTYPVDATHNLAAYHQWVSQPWAQVNVSVLNGRQLQDGEKVLILYGTYTAADVKALEDAEPSPPDFVKALEAQHNASSPF